MVKVLIINAHSSKNKGDAAIIISMIQSIRKFNKDSEITISSRYPEDDELYVQYGCQVVEQITRFPDKNFSYFKRLIYTFKELKEVNRFVKTGDIPDGRDDHIFKKYNEADIVVSCGGGFIYSHSKLVEASLIMHLAQIYFAKKLHKKVITYAQSIGPFHSKLSKFMSYRVLSQVDVITVREELSQVFLNEIGIKQTVMVGDSAFVIETDHIDVSRLIDLSKSKVNVGVTVRQWTFPNQQEPEKKYQNYLHSVADAITHVVHQIGGIVYLVPQVTGPTPIEDDRIGSKQVSDLLSEETKKSVVLLSKDYTPVELKAIYSEMDLFIGTRMHSNIFSLSSNVPTIAISYEPKTTGIMKMLNLSQYVCEINNISSKEIVAKTQLAWDNRKQYRSHLEIEIPIMKERAEEPAKVIQSLISGDLGENAETMVS